MPLPTEASADATWRLAAKKMTFSISRSVRESVLAPVDVDPLRSAAPVGTVSPMQRVAPVLVAEPSSLSLANASTDVVELQVGELDPLSALMSSVDLEPPKAGQSNQKQAHSTNLLGETTRAMVEEHVNDDDTKNSYLDEWATQKDLIFQTFAADRFQIKVDANPTASAEDEASEVRRKAFVYSDSDPSATPIMQRARARLEQLEKKEETESTTVEVSQSEYIHRIKTLQQDFLNAWHDDQKVLALRITIKCIKLLGDTSFPKFYPCMFVLVSDVLDCFGSHVYYRIKAKAEEHHLLPSSFSSMDVDIEAKETCRNWFYKTACIRELLPRIYTEIALLRCYRFLCDGEYPHIVTRLSNMIKGVGDPTVALYTRTYLALASSRVLAGHPNTAILHSLQDYMYIMHRFSIEKAAVFYTQQEMSEAGLRAIHAPGVQWLIKSVAQTATEKDVDSLLYQYKQYAENGMVLEQIVATLPGALLSKHTMGLVQLIQQTTNKEELFRALSLKLVESPPPANEKLVFLNTVWGTITRLVDIHKYLRCAAAFVALLVTHYSSREVVILLQDVVRHLNSTESMDAAMYQSLESIMEVIILEARRQTHYFSTIVPSTEFLTLLGMFQHSTNITLSKRLLHAFVRGKDRRLRLAVEGPHAAIVHILMTICIRVHDALDSLSSPLDMQEASAAICTFVRSLDMAASHEDGLLQMYVECRRVFYKLDLVKSCLIRRVMWLALLVDCRTRRSFVKGCLAYCHITIPSLGDGLEKLKLSIACAKIALASHCLPQMDAFVKASIVLITELPSAAAAADDADHFDGSSGGFSHDTYELVVVHAMTDLLSLLVVVPSASPEDPLYFVMGFRNAAAKFPWATPSKGHHARVLIQMLPLLATWVPDQPLPYTIGHVAANDVLFGGSRILPERLTDEAASIIHDIGTQLQELVPELPSASASKSAPPSRDRVNLQGDLVLDLVNTLAATVQLNTYASGRLVKLMAGVASHHALLHGQSCNSDVKHQPTNMCMWPEDIKAYWRRTRTFLLQAASTSSRSSWQDATAIHAFAQGLQALQMV
ncbi:Aste57867_8911 [Aphanomyces stellatus]|uniref:Aste57867_8911 protein n=1 Tax=Aphanomyces stellatus TaxID=120398 RepID=A0A485KLF2_9STRA|nr:hypothetical protein As57867_008876 [Aphanomyces stellatus]VFT85795.1 Aste57867_8911 [Aphanomyces stellatus]